MEKKLACLKVRLKDAEAAKQFLLGQGVLAKGALAFRRGSFFYLPLAENLLLGAKKPQTPRFPSSVSTASFQVRDARDFGQVLLDCRVLSKAQSGERLSYDVVGDIAVLEASPVLKRREKKIAELLLARLQPQVKVIAAKKGVTQGKFRVRKLRVLAGERRTSTICRENGCSFGIDLNAAYFNTRLSAERLRISSLAAPGEKILVLFAGVGPYAIEIARRQPSAKVVGVELNPAAVKFFEKNVVLNKVANVEIIGADAARVLGQKRFARWADRVVMPLPKTAKKFLPAAIKATKKGGVIHYYSIASELQPDVFATAVADAKAACRLAKRKLVFLAARKAIPYAPRVAQVVLDFRAD